MDLGPGTQIHGFGVSPDMGPDGFWPKPVKTVQRAFQTLPSHHAFWPFLVRAFPGLLGTCQKWTSQDPSWEGPKMTIFEGFWLGTSQKPVSDIGASL